MPPCRAPAGADPLEVSLEALEGLAPRVILGPGESSAAVDEDERRRPLRVGRGENEGHDRGADPRHEGRSLGADLVEDRPDVVDPLLDRGKASTAIGSDSPVPRLSKTMTRLNDASWFSRRARGGNVPHGIDVAEPLVDEDEVDRAVAEDLVGDVQLTDAGIARLWDRDRVGRHGPSVAGPRAARKRGPSVE